MVVSDININIIYFRCWLDVTFRTECVVSWFIVKCFYLRLSIRSIMWSNLWSTLCDHKVDHCSHKIDHCDHKVDHWDYKVVLQSLSSPMSVIRETCPRLPTIAIAVWTAGRKRFLRWQLNMTILLRGSHPWLTIPKSIPGAASGFGYVYWDIQ